MRLDPYYLHSARRRPEAAGFLKRLVAATRGTSLTITHSDYSPKNVLVRRGRLVLLDHEIMHWGDGAFDVGFALTHLLAKALHVGGKRREFVQAATLFWETYTSSAGPPFSEPLYESRVAAHTIGCLCRQGRRSSTSAVTSVTCRRSAAVSLALDPPTDVPSVVAAFEAVARSSTSI